MANEFFTALPDGGDAPVREVSTQFQQCQLWKLLRSQFRRACLRYRFHPTRIFRARRQALDLPRCPRSQLRLRRLRLPIPGAAARGSDRAFGRSGISFLQDARPIFARQEYRPGGPHTASEASDEFMSAPIAADSPSIGFRSRPCRNWQHRSCSLLRLRWRLRSVL